MSDTGGASCFCPRWTTALSRLPKSTLDREKATYALIAAHSRKSVPFVGLYPTMRGLQLNIFSDKSQDMIFDLTYHKDHEGGYLEGPLAYILCYKGSKITVPHFSPKSITHICPFEG